MLAMERTVSRPNRHRFACSARHLMSRRAPFTIGIVELRPLGPLRIVASLSRSEPYTERADGPTEHAVFMLNCEHVVLLVAATGLVD